MNNIPTARLVFDVKKKSTREIKGLVQIVVTLNRKRHYYSTGVKLYNNQWNETSHVVNSSQSVELNDMLNAMMRKVNDYIRKCYEQEKPISFADIERLFSVESKEEVSFLDFLEDRVENRPDIGAGTRKHHRVLLDTLKEYGKIKYFSDLTKANILDFYDYVQTGSRMQTTVYNYIKNLKTYVNQAIDRGLIDKDPFIGVKMDRGKNKLRVFLTEEELRKLATSKIDIAPVAKARDLFVFQCYTGLAYADMATFDFERDVEQINGKYIITSRRVKSDEAFYIVLMKPAIAILRRYGYKLPIMTNQEYNNYLKIACASAGINKKISSHSGRHTFAIIALNNGIQMEVVAKILGHADIRTTKVYAKVLNTSVDSAFADLEKKLKKKGAK